MYKVRAFGNDHGGIFSVLNVAIGNFSLQKVFVFFLEEGIFVALKID